MTARKIFDPLYAAISFPSEIEELLFSPLVQRLRHIRLSNIDSLEMPGVANISRFEHVTGAAHLASQVQVASTHIEKIILQSAALLHDASITPYGHLVEEAVGYRAQFDHEKRLGDALAESTSTDLGGEDFQVLNKRSGLRDWALRHFGSDARIALDTIMQAVRGKGHWGRLISGSVDLDNLDNVARMAFHMGLEFDRALPLRIAQSIVGLSENHEPIFSDDAVPKIEKWLSLRRDVYEKLMLSRADFTGKAMLIYSTVRAMEVGDFDDTDWKLMDFQFINLLATSKNVDVATTASRWLLGDLWSLSDLQWFEGSPPPYDKVYSFSEMVSTMLGRTAFAYRIKEKRFRELTIRTETSQVTLGENRNQWLLGVSSPAKTSFSKRENLMITRAACEHFNTSLASQEQKQTLSLF